MLSDRLKTKIEIYCYFVDKGKPTAMLPVKIKDISEVVKVIKKENLNYFSKPLSREAWKAFGYDDKSSSYKIVDKINENYIQVWIYKRPIMLEIIKNLPKKPETIYDHWVLGKACGFSEESIEEFIKEWYRKDN